MSHASTIPPVEPAAAAPTDSVSVASAAASAAVKRAQAACDRIAPAWPLDQSIAVNPWWSLTESGLDALAPDFAAKSGARLVMPRAYFKQSWAAGRIHEQSLLAARDERGQTASVAELLAHLDRPLATERMSLMPHVLDAERDLDRHVAWEEEITHQISQFCAAYFDQGQAAWHFDTTKTVYAKWLQTVAHDRGIPIIMGCGGLSQHFQALPTDAEATIAGALQALQVAPEAQADYMHALLLSINGWASACAYRHWQAALYGSSDDSTLQLLAIRLAWEWVLLRVAETQGLADRWPLAKAHWSAAIVAQRADNALDWVWQRALEIEYQHDLAARLAGVGQPAAPSAPLVQAAFCIDVRSEVYRRALEGVSDRAQTLGFAGFFGMPIAYQAPGSDHRRIQLPGLLAPSLLVREASDQGESDRQRRRLSELWRQFKSAGTSTFSFVEVAGLLYATKLLRASVPKTPAPEMATRQDRPPVHIYDAPGDQELDAAAKAELAAAILGGMGLTTDLAPLVLLVGHGSSSVNNPLASGLDCGACCGQSGEINARAVVAMLNDPEVRQALHGHGITVPAGTHFIAGLHNTTTDDIILFNAGDTPAALRPQLDEISQWLVAASASARAERAASLQESSADAGQLHAALIGRSQDWSQVRPEWGLTGNAAFIIAPRSRTRGVDLQGRSFLHDYAWHKDPEFSLLEKIMTAPMVVTHWINMQYYASTVDNQRYGSGNKVLHNVVGGDLGVFEGNGGDLRIGLAKQSLHNGEEWVHQPVRLSVFIEAPRDAIAGILAKHEKVRQLVDNEWLFLYQLDTHPSQVYRYKNAHWAPVNSSPN